MGTSPRKFRTSYLNPKLIVAGVAEARLLWECVIIPQVLYTDFVRFCSAMEMTSLAMVLLRNKLTLF